MDDRDTPPRSFDVAGYAAAAFALTVLAAQNSLAKWAVDHGLTAPDLVAIRFGIPGVVWLPLVVRRIIRGGRPAAVRVLTFAATAGVPYGLILTSGYRYSNASHGSVIVPSATLTFGVLLSSLVVRQPLTRLTAASVVVALVGMSLVSGIWWEASAGASSLPGDLLFALSGLVWAGHLAAVGYWKAPAREIVPAVMSGSVLYLPYYFATSDLPGRLLAGSGPPTHVLVWVTLFLAVLHSSIALPLYAWATGRLTPMRISLLTPSVPLIGVTIAVLTLGERFESHEVAGAALVLLALALASRSKVRRADSPGDEAAPSASGGS